MTRTYWGAGFSVVGGAIAGWGEWQTSHHSVTKTLAVTAADTTINLAGAIGSDMLTGALIGTSMGPGVGTAIGLAVGVVTAVGTYFAEKYLNQAIDNWSGAVTSNVSKAASTVGHAVSSAWNTVSSWF